MNIYVKLWTPKDAPIDTPKLGVNWYPHGWKRHYKGYSLDFIAFGYQLHFTYVNSHPDYIKAHGNLLELDEIDFALWGMSDFKKIDQEKRKRASKS